MNLEMIYSGCSTLAIIGWLALALAPVKRDYAISFARGIVIILALAYLAQLLLITEKVEGGGFSTLAAVQALFTKSGNVMMGWTHYLAFDLFIGSWQAEDAPRSGVPHWLLIPCLILTLLFGPIGLLLYLAIRTVKRRAAPRAS